MNAMTKYLNETGLTQEQAAEHLSARADYGISQTQVSQFARGARQPRFQFGVRLWLRSQRGTPEHRLAVGIMNEIDPGLGDDLDSGHAPD